MIVPTPEPLASDSAPARPGLPASEIRHDRSVEIRKPVAVGGGVRFQVVDSRALVPLHYPLRGVTEVATVEALSSEEYLDALRGIPVRVGHPPGPPQGDGLHKDSDPKAGVLLTSRWDPTVEPSGGTVTEYLVDDPTVARRILSRELRDVSLGYRVPVDAQRVREDGVIEQLRRIPDHLALAPEGRMPGATTRVDAADAAGGTMTEEQWTKLMEALTALAAGMQILTERMDAMKPKADAEEMPAAVEVTDEMVEARADALATDQLEVLRAADALGVKVPEGAKGVRAIAKAVATALGAPTARADSLDADRAWIASARHQRAALGEQRSDSNDGASTMSSGTRVKADTTPYKV